MAQTPTPVPSLSKQQMYEPYVQLPVSETAPAPTAEAVRETTPTPETSLFRETTNFVAFGGTSEQN